MPKRARSRRAVAPAQPSLRGRTSPAHLYACGALALLCLLAYANAFGGDFVLDSRVLILEDPRIRELSASNLDLIANRTYWWPYKTADDLYRPVTTLSYLFNYAILGHGAQPAGYHAVNVLLHVLNVVLAYLVAWRLSGHLLASAALAAVWAVHPLATEAVTNIIGRADLLAALGVLGAFYAYLRATTAQGAARGVWLGAAAGLATIGVFSKESAVAVVGIVVLYDLLVRKPRRPFTALLPAWVVMALPVLLLLVRRSSVLATLPTPQTLMVDNPIVGVGFWQGLLTAIAVLPRYVWLTLWPLRLSADYSYAQIPPATGTLADWLGWLAFAGLTAAIIAAVRRWRFVAFGAASAFVALLPASNLLFPTGTIMGERLAYLPMLGILACVGMVLTWVAARVGLSSRARLAVLGVLMVLLTARTWVRNGDWDSDLALWRSAVEAAPASFKSHQGYADALYESDPTRANLAEVVAHSHRSAEILSGIPDDRTVTRVYRLAAVYALEYADQLRDRGADDEGRRMDAAGVRYAQRHVEVVMAARGGGRAGATGLDGDATRELADAYRLLATAQGNLAADDPAAGNLALAAAERASELEPLSPVSYRSTAAAQVAAGRYDEGAATFLAGFMVTGDGSLRESVIQLYRSGLDPEGCATTPGPTGPTLNPACEPVRRHLCVASRDAARTERARGRNDLAENLEAAALQSFGCPPSFFSPGN